MVTPIRRQYLDLKRRHPGAILFFRMGDFYETFDDDAVLCARELEITLTSRELGKGHRIPMAGVPHHAAESYVARLIERGHRVAIVEQLSDPATSKGLVDRDVVRIVTPGTVIEPGMLQPKTNNFLVAVLPGERDTGIAVLDITTGEFSVTQLPSAGAAAEIERLSPAEIVAPADTEIAGAPAAARTIRTGTPITRLEGWRFDVDTARQSLLRHFGVSTLEGFGCDHLPLAVGAAGAALSYVQETQRTAVSHLVRLTTYSTTAFMSLDHQTRRNLEILLTSRTGASGRSLLAILDLTETPMGGRLLKRWLSQPLLDRAAIARRHNAVEALHGDSLSRTLLMAELRKVADLERLANRVALGVALPRELLALRRSLEAVPGICDLIPEQLRGAGTASPLVPSPAGYGLTPPAAAGTPLHRKWRGDGGEAGPADDDVHGGNNGNPAPDARTAVGVSSSVDASFRDRLDPCPAVQRLVAVAIAEDTPAGLSDGGVIRPEYSEELDQLRAAARDGRSWIAGLERVERERTGIRSLKVGYNRVFGYYLEVTNPNLDVPVPSAMRREVLGPDGSEPCRCPSVREHLERCLGYTRKQTLVGAERFFTPELKEYESRILNAQERQVELEQSLFRDVCQQIAASVQRLLGTAAALAELDVYAAFAEVAARHRYVRPELVDDTRIEIRAARHPVVEQLVRDPAFVPNDVQLDRASQQVIVLTGPNMAGKSTYILTVGLVALLCQVGSFVPAERAVLGVVDRIFTRVGAQMDLSAGQSTFMVEMAETALALLHATDRSLLIFDEIGRGTSTFDGLAIARAVLEYLVDAPQANQPRPLTLFATHYHELAELEREYPRIRNYRTDIAESEQGIVFLYQIVPGAADRSYGVHVAKLAGVPARVLRRAQELLEGLEAASAKQLKVGSVARQLRLIDATPTPSALHQRLDEIDVADLSPRSAIDLVFELQQQARAELGKRPGATRSRRPTAAKTKLGQS